jgi:GNAT superfamily N-acetyltransferase
MIRPIEKSDRGPLLTLLQATGNFNEAELVIAEELIDSVINKPNQDDYYGFVHDREPGAGGLVIVGPVPATSGSWHMYWIAVHPDFQGTGIAQKLDQWAESFVRSRGGLLAYRGNQWPAVLRAHKSILSKAGVPGAGEDSGLLQTLRRFVHFWKKIEGSNIDP